GGGNFVIVWTSAGQDGPGDPGGIYGKQFSWQNGGLPAPANTIAVNGNEFRVHEPSLAGSQTAPAIAMNAAGQYIVVWQHQVAGNPSHIETKRFTISAAVGGQFAGSLLPAGQQDVEPAVAIDQDGNYVIAWRRETTAAAQGSIYATWFNN